MSATQTTKLRGVIKQLRKSDSGEGFSVLFTFLDEERRLLHIRYRFSGTDDRDVFHDSLSESVGNIKALIGARHPSVPRPRSVAVNGGGEMEKLLAESPPRCC